MSALRATSRCRPFLPLLRASQPLPALPQLPPFPVAQSKISPRLFPTHPSLFSSARFFTSSTPAGNTSRVIAVKGDAEYMSALNLAQENKGLAVVYFTAKWCGPCKMISPIVDELSIKYEKATFLKVDIDEEKLSEIVAEEKISSVPTFRFFQGGKSWGEVIGANANALKEKLAAWSNI